MMRKPLEALGIASDDYQYGAIRICHKRDQSVKSV
jgi:hypothetical protein